MSSQDVFALTYDPYTNFVATKFSHEEFQDVIREFVRTTEIAFNPDVRSFLLHEADHARRTVTHTSGLLMRRAISALNTFVFRALNDGPIFLPVIDPDLFDDVLTDLTIEVETGALFHKWGTSHSSQEIALSVAAILAFTEEVAGYFLIPTIADRNVSSA